MSSLSTVDPDKLTIKNFIFHVVHTDKDQPELLDEIDFEDFHDFFIERVKETLKGNRFQFNEHSASLAALRDIDTNPRHFVDKSKELATNFHTRRNKLIHPGVMILMKLVDTNNTYYSIIKYDHEDVIHYEINQAHATLKKIRDSFTKSASAMHKSAFIKLTKRGGDLIVVDRKVRKDISDFFKGFLDVKRSRSNAEMTQFIYNTAQEIAKKYNNVLPADVTKNLRARSYRIIQNTETFEPDDFIKKLFGEYLSDDIKTDFSVRLKKSDMEGEEFSFDKDAVMRPTERRIKTVEGIEIKVPETAKHIYKERSLNGGKTEISIITEKIIEQ